MTGVMLLAPMSARGDIGAAIGKIMANTEGALAIIEFDIENEVAKSTMSELGICILPNGTLMTSTFNVRTLTEFIKKVRIVIPGVERKTLKAKLLGIDQVSGLTFVQAAEPHSWKVVKFAERSNLKVGQAVISLGLLGPDLAYKVGAGAGRVATVVRAPGRLAYVTGGNLTRIGSPVFNEKGVAIGLVQRQLFQQYQIVQNRRSGSVRMSPVERTNFFTPVEEFAHGLKTIPAGRKVRRVPWIGVMRFQPLPKSMADTLKITKPAVLVGKVVDDTPAKKAGLRDGDIVVAVNGKPLERFPNPQMILQQFATNLARMGTGTKFTMTIGSAMEKRTVTLELVRGPTRPSEAKRYFGKRLGVLLREKVPIDAVADEGPTGKLDGLYVLSVGRDSAAAKAGLRPQDLVISISGTPVKTVDQVTKLVNDSLTRDPRKGITFVVKRGEQTEAITIQPSQPR